MIRALRLARNLAENWLRAANSIIRKGMVIVSCANLIMFTKLNSNGHRKWDMYHDSQGTP
jgi:hypothetical protein